MGVSWKNESPWCAWRNISRLIMADRLHFDLPVYAELFEIFPKCISRMHFCNNSLDISWEHKLFAFEEINIHRLIVLFHTKINSMEKLFILTLISFKLPYFCFDTPLCFWPLLKVESMNRGETDFSRSPKSLRFWQGAIYHAWASHFDKHWQHSHFALSFLFNLRFNLR